jgi:[ribosomal protein S5]-alanine N-acetyltransferase
MPRGELGTARLVLRRPRLEDATGVLAVLSDPRAVEHNPSDRVDDLDMAGALVARWIQHWSAHGFGYWCVFEHGSDELGGICGLKRMTVHGQPVLNLLYRLRPQLWGQGYASEAGMAVLACARDQQLDGAILARVRPENVASQHVATKLGLRRDAELDIMGDDGMDWAFTNR